MMKINYFTAILLIFFPGCNKESSVTIENNDLKCDKYLGGYHILIDDTHEIDLSRLNSLEIYKDKIYMSVPQEGRIVVFDVNTEEFKTIGETGRGPFEFLLPSIIVAGNVLYIFDHSSSKFAKYDLELDTFILEQVLDTRYSGISMHTGSNAVFLNTLSRISNDKYERHIISFQDDFQKIDTVFTSVSNDIVRYFEDGRDFAGQFPLFSNIMINFINDDLYLFDNTTFTYYKNNTLNDDNAKINYNYMPDYDFYIEAMRERFNTDPNLSVYFLDRALINETRDYVALFSEVLASETHLLFSLFASDKNAFLIKDLKNQDFTIFCTDLNYRPVRIKESKIYWITHNDNYEYSLIKTEI